ncbi:MAG: Lrp/AsnC family transcriptional regulator [Candidatus Rokubacteria bacterium]|nr:Lrp/AsnC family transcriptional regulator [Candidatus Rokubacteria bacterium]
MDTIRLAPVDVGIIHCLHRDARRSAASIAGQLGIPESTVRHRLNRLVRRGIVEFAALTNPLQLGYQIWAIIEVQAELRKIRPVAQRLAAAPEVYFVGITTGGYDVLAAAVFRSNDELLDFITRRLSGIPGIVRTSTSSVLEVVKRTMTFPLPDTMSRERRVRKARARTAKGRGGRAIRS